MASNRKKKSSLFDRNHLMMYIVIGSFVVSGLFVGIGMEPAPAPDDFESNPDFVIYDSENLMGEGIVSIGNFTGDYTLIPRSPQSLSQDSVTRAITTKVDGVSSIILEQSPQRISFKVNTFEEVEADTLKNKIRLPGGFDIFEIWEATSQAGPLLVIGTGITEGETASVLVMERKNSAGSEFLGFYQGLVVEGPVVDGSVLAIEGYAFAGQSIKNITEDEITRIVYSADEIQISETSPRMINFKTDVDTDAEKAIEGLEDAGIENVSASKLGWTDVPDSMALNGQLIQIPKQSGAVQTTLFLNASVNDSVRVQVIPINIGNQTVVFGMQVIE